MKSEDIDDAQASADVFPAPPPSKPRGPAGLRGRYGRLRTLALVAVVALLVGLAGGYLLARSAGDDNTASAQPSTSADSSMQAARSNCGAQYAVVVSDGGRTLVIDGQGKEDSSGVSTSVLDCLLDQLHAPTSVVEQMYSTRALDGRQQADWPNYHASWTYHPDHGLDLIVTRSGS